MLNFGCAEGTHLEAYVFAEIDGLPEKEVTAFQLFAHFWDSSWSFGSYDTLIHAK